MWRYFCTVTFFIYFTPFYPLPHSWLSLFLLILDLRHSLSHPHCIFSQTHTFPAPVLCPCFFSCPLLSPSAPVFRQLLILSQRAGFCCHSESMWGICLKSLASWKYAGLSYISQWQAEQLHNLNCQLQGFIISRKDNGNSTKIINHRADKMLQLTK